MLSNDNSIILTESYGVYGKKNYYVKPADQKKVNVVSLDNSLAKSVLYGFKNIFSEIFLPQGYPFSVSDDYAGYQIWDTAQAFCSTITGILATQSVMKGVGVGDTEATPLAATITWVLKDGTGHIGRIAFAWWKGTSLDADSKIWRLIADCLNDAAICLELAIPFFKGYTTYVLCLSTAMKAIVGVAGGATRAALTQHQAIRGNLADVAAKDGSQETAVNLIASLVALLIISLVGENVWPLFFLFTVFHIFSNYMAVKSVCLKSFNRTRFLQVLNLYLQNETVMSTKQANIQEPIFPLHILTEKTLYNFNIRIGHSLKQVTDNMTATNFKNIIGTFRGLNYIIIVDNCTKNIFVVLNESISSEDLLCSYFHANIYAIAFSYINEERILSINNEKLELCNKFHEFYSDLQNHFRAKINESKQIPVELYSQINKYVLSEWETFSKNLCENGWWLKNELLLAQEWRARWHE